MLITGLIKRQSRMQLDLMQLICISLSICIQNDKSWTVNSLTFCFTVTGKLEKQISLENSLFFNLFFLLPISHILHSKVLAVIITVTLYYCKKSSQFR